MHHCKLEYLFAAVLLIFVLTSQAADSTPGFGPAPVWVKPATALPGLDRGANTNTEGISYALLDRQLNLATSEDYSRTVKDLVTQAGVQEGARLTVNYDPSYQQLTIHHIRVTRGSNTLDRFDPLKVRVLQREQDLERHIYDGSLSAVVFLEDVRVGDRIDTAFTIRGNNPIFHGKYVGSALLRWHVPIGRNHLRLLVPVGRSVLWRTYGGNYPPAVAETGEGQEYVWDLHNVPAVEAEAAIPLWMDTYPWIQFSEFGTWQEVGQWAASLYPRDGKDLPPELLQAIEAWKTLNTSPEEKVRIALDFVQEEIRYLGIELGTGSHRPRTPAEVFGTRFGDCKDKSLLLCAILDRLGLEAWPVLVHSYYRAEVGKLLPSPYAFNHVITAARTPSGVLYVDPTRGLQRGPLNQRYLPDYGLGLPVSAGTYSLARLVLPELKGPFLDVLERFSVHGKTNLAGLQVHTTYTGPAAERYRFFVAQNRPEEIERLYLNYYAQNYPGIGVKDPLRVVQSTNQNTIETFESYLITNLWELDETKSHYNVNFYPQSMAARLDPPNIANRKQPLALDFPVHEHLRIEANFSEDGPVGSKTNTYASAAFQFTGIEKFYERTLVLDYDYKSLTNYVSVADLLRHTEKLRELKGELGYRLTWGGETTGHPLAGVNWPILVLGILSTILLSLGTLWLYRYDPPARAVPPPRLEEPAQDLRGIGGWLILVAIGLLLSGPLRAVQFVQGISTYALPNWHAVTSPGQPDYHPVYAPYLIFALVINIGIILLSILVPVLFFQQRTSFPRLFVTFLATSAIASALGTAALSVLPGGVSPADLQETTRAILPCGIWIPYVLLSRRVALTFTRRRQVTPIAVPPVIPVLPTPSLMQE